MWLHLLIFIFQPQIPYLVHQNLTWATAAGSLDSLAEALESSGGVL